MKFLFLTLLVALFSINTVYGSSCAEGWTKHGRKCFRASDMAGTFSGADAVCGEMVSRTATIYSKDEQKFLEKFLFNQTGVKNQNIWLGGHRQNLKFAWRNDEVLIEGNVYANWASGKPSFTFPKACLQMNSAVDAEPGKWSDEFCYATNYIVCERFNDGTNIDDDDDDDDDSDNDNDIDIGNNCCQKLEKKLEKLEEKMEKQFEKIEDKIDENSDRIKRLENNLKDIQKEVDVVGYKMVEISEAFSQIDLTGIERNFTGIASVLDFLNNRLDEIYQIVKARPEDIDLSFVKLELVRYIDETLAARNLDEIVNDAKLSYVHFRRALMVKKNGKWLQIGYV